MRGLLIALLVIAGCGIEVSHKAIGPGTYSIKAKGRARHDSGDVMEALHERAAKLCPAGYDIVDETSGSKVGVYSNPNTGQASVWSRPDGGMIVRCR